MTTTYDITTFDLFCELYLNRLPQTIKKVRESIDVRDIARYVSEFAIQDSKILKWVSFHIEGDHRPSINLCSASVPSVVKEIAAIIPNEGRPVILPVRVRRFNKTHTGYVIIEPTRKKVVYIDPRPANHILALFAALLSTALKTDLACYTASFEPTDVATGFIAATVCLVAFSANIPSTRINHACINNENPNGYLLLCYLFQKQIERMQAGVLTYSAPHANTKTYCQKRLRTL